VLVCYSTFLFQRWTASSTYLLWDEKWTLTCNGQQWMWCRQHSLLATFGPKWMCDQGGCRRAQYMLLRREWMHAPIRTRGPTRRPSDTDIQKKSGYFKLCVLFNLTIKKCISLWIGFSSVVIISPDSFWVTIRFPGSRVDFLVWCTYIGTFTSILWLILIQF